MKFSIYQMAIYDIINKIRKVNPLYHFYYDRFLAEKQVGYKNEYRLSCESLLNDLIEYTDKLDSLFPAIDQKTYCMIVCGTIMQVFVSNLNEEVRIDENFIERLKSPFADEKTKEYFKHIYGALKWISDLRNFEPSGEIIEWPHEFAFAYENPRNADWVGEYMEKLYDEIIDAIELCPSYEYAYCLLTVPYIHRDVGLYFPPIASNLRFKKAFIKGHKCMGDELFAFLFTGEYYIYEPNAHYELRNSIYSNSEEVEKSRIEHGYYMIDGKPSTAWVVNLDQASYDCDALYGPIFSLNCKKLTTEGSTGDITLDDCTAAEIAVKTSTGDVRFAGSDAAKITVKTSTGDVIGSLRTPKVFTVNTSTGDVSVPHSSEGGSCEIKTSTGDVRIKIN